MGDECYAMLRHSTIFCGRNLVGAVELCSSTGGEVAKTFCTKSAYKAMHLVSIKMSMLFQNYELRLIICRTATEDHQYY